nr:replication enhancer protein [Dolichos yellow mosaic virus]
MTDSRTGESITAAQLQSGVFIWELKNPLSFKILEHHEGFLFDPNQHRTKIRIMFNHGLKKALGIHKAFLDFVIYHRLTPQSGRILNVFRNFLSRFLNNLGIISMNNVLRGCEYVLYDVFQRIEAVDFEYNVQWKLY